METLGNLFLTTLWIFLLMAWLVVLFQILGDLFRDPELSGWWKAVWVLALIFVPFLSALIYLIARGTGMQERGLAALRERQSSQEAYIRQVASADPVSQIASAQELLAKGAITQAEFDTLKAKALG